MANGATNFSLLTSEQKTVWSRDLWEQARNVSFIGKFLGKDSNSIIQRVSELKASEKGARAVLTLVHDMEGDGVAGDRTLKGNEEKLRSSDIVIQLDQLRNANTNEGKMSDQKSIVNFREQSRDKLAYWLADRIDQLAFLTMAGLSYSVKNSGGTRTGSDLPYLEFATTAADAPTSKRVGQWDEGTKSIVWGGATTSIVGGAVGTADFPCWEMLVQAKAYAKDNYIRGVREKGGEETYHVFFSPQAMARLKLDPTFMQNLRHAQTRDSSNPLFSGSTVKIDGLYLHEFRHVPNTRNAASGSKYGASGTVDGCQVLFAGAQALGFADLGDPEWNEEYDDYKNRMGIETGKILGFKKPKFYTQYSGGTTEDFGILSLYTAQ